jgi:hypothetical protein
MITPNVIPFEYQGQPVHFSTEGWINATEIAKRFGREPTAWLRQRETVEYMCALAEAIGKSGSLTELLKIKELDGRKAASRAKFLRLAKQTGLVEAKAGVGGGVWLHPKMGVSFARWLDVDFAVWCDLQINALLHNGVSVQQQFDQACKALTDRRGLAQWRQEKPPLEERAEYWRRELQLALPLVDGEAV